MGDCVSSTRFGDDGGRRRKGIEPSGTVCNYAEALFADVVADRDTSVFRPTPAETAALPSKCAAGTGQSGLHFVTLTVPTGIPIQLVWNGRPLSLTPGS